MIIRATRVVYLRFKWLQIWKGRFYVCFWQVLKKHPDFDCCLALKCLALMRLGRETEASTILDKVIFQILTKQQSLFQLVRQSFPPKVLASNPVDEGALNAMTIAFRELQVESPIPYPWKTFFWQEPGKICRMYEGAVGKEPTNEEFLTHLFMSYVR